MCGGDILLNVEIMRDSELSRSSYGDSGGVGGNVEWLGLPIRSFNSVVDEGKGVKCGNGYFLGREIGCLVILVL